MQVGKISGAYTAPVFQRKLRDNEKTEYKHDTIRQAYEFLGVKDVALAIHGSSFPVAKNDLGIGSPFSAVSKDVIDMEILHGFTSTQLGPLGEITRTDISPYASTVWAKNKMFIDINALTEDEYANILDTNEISPYAVTYKDKKSPDTYSKFYEAFENYDLILEKAYDNFKLKLSLNDKKAEELNNEYTQFKALNGQRVMKEALYNVLTKVYGTENFEKWESEIDRNLPQLLEKRNPEAIERYRYLMNRNSKDVGQYCFSQFLIDKQMKAHKDFRESMDFKYINDILVGTSKMEEYIYKDAFLQGIRMGCPFGGKYGPQLWDFPVPDPQKLFNYDGSLGPAGKFIEEKFKVALKDCENIRIDHAMGLVDPYVYDKNSVEIINGQLNCGKFRGDNISNMRDLDPEGNYKKILERIILPLLKEHGINPEDAVWEDLGTQTPTFKEIYQNKHNLPGITQLEWQRAENVNKRENWSYIGVHDSEPALKMFEKSWVRDSAAWQPEYLGGYLNYDPERADLRRAFVDRIADNPMERVKAKFAELFTCSDKIQIFFADFFGINKTYNYGGQNVSTNWKLRLNKNFEDAYYENLSSDNPTALNLPEILKMAVRAKIDMMVVDKMKTNPEQVHDYRQSINSRMQPLLDRLDKFENILKEKE